MVVESPAVPRTLGVVVVKRLHEARNVWLATVRSDGRPHVAQLWFVYVEDRIWIGTGLTSVRVRNLRSNPAASACLEPGDEPQTRGTGGEPGDSRLVLGQRGVPRVRVDRSDCRSTRAVVIAERRSQRRRPPRLLRMAGT